MPLPLALAIDMTPSVRSELALGGRGSIGLAALALFIAAFAFSTSHVADALLVELPRWSAKDVGRTQDDDITLLILTLLPSP